MYLQNRFLAADSAQQEFRLRLRQTLANLQSSLDLNDVELMSQLEITKRQYQLFKNGNYDLKLTNIISLSNSLGVSLDLIFSGKIDYSALSKQFSNQEPVLPERYTPAEHQLALNRSLGDVFDYLSYYHGNEYSKTLFKRLQIPITFLSDRSRYISPLMQLDYFEILKKEGFELGTFRAIGEYSAARLRTSPLAERLGRTPDSQTLYETFFEQSNGYIDHFFNYRILSSKENSFLLEMTPIADKHDLFRGEIRKCEFSCQFKLGLFSSLLTFAGKPHAQYRERSCWFHGDGSCKIELYWDEFPQAADFSF